MGTKKKPCLSETVILNTQKMFKVIGRKQIQFYAEVCFTETMAHFELNYSPYCSN